MIVPNRADTRQKREQVAEMFDNISGSYDRLNHILSFGIDRGWRAKLIRDLVRNNPTSVLDVATGTGDLAIEIARSVPGVLVTGADISKGMLDVGRIKIKQRNLQDRIQMIVGDSEQLPFADNQFDGVVAAFGVRNFQHPVLGLAEMCRVLKPGGFLGILEFGKPANPLVARLYSFYFLKILPLVGRLVSKHQSAYTYLPESVNSFQYGNAFVDLMKQAGFAQAAYKPLTFGVCMYYTATKSQSIPVQDAPGR
jgi:demethylmenaquinone methyltransferase/2-methoxy-6-polyprenyl-1,4-benzoquinol methylase